jgi:hypothetical protein
MALILHLQRETKKAADTEGMNNIFTLIVPDCSSVSSGMSVIVPVCNYSSLNMTKLMQLMPPGETMTFRPNFTSRAGCRCCWWLT